MKPLYLFLIVIPLLSVLTGCASTSHVTQAHSATEQKNAYQSLLSHYDQWKGTPYVWGGNTRQGVDCSGFMQRTFRDALGLGIPRSTELQSQIGSTIRANNLQVGDLVFFKTSKKVRHVGVYMGRGEFLHASTSKGVTISRMDNPYWKKAYWMARRVN